MTLENFQYRTNPLFLRDQFAGDADVFGIPTIPKPYFNESELLQLRLIGFDRIKQDNGKHSKRMVHFFLYDYKFEKLWKNPQQYVEMLQAYRGVLTPDFSMYTEMPIAMQLFNTFRNRWCGAYLARQGLRIVPTVNWGTEESFDFCFAGIEKGSVVAVSTYMFHAHGNHADQKDLFMKGYKEMLRQIEPEYVICYSEPFPDMEGNIIYVDYDLSSWRHMEDDIVPKEAVKHTYGILTRPPVRDIIIKTGYVCKGGGSAFGGDWKPKDKNSERFLGKPNTIQKNSVTTRKGSYEVLDKYDSKGRAVAERHFTEHTPNKIHSNPHDHIIDWSKNFPDFSSPINYKNSATPTFEEFIREIFGEISENIQEGEKSMKNYEYNPEDYKFETLGEFKFYLSCGANVGFEYNGIEYGIEGHDNKFIIWTYDERLLAENITLEEVLDYKLDGVKIRDLILTAEITERIM